MFRNVWPLKPEAMTSSVFSIPAQLDRMDELVHALDPLNIRILGSLNKHGPRNLLRAIKGGRLPASTVYNRFARLESRQPITFAYPRLSKLGLVFTCVLANPTPGKDSVADQALRILGYWRSVASCEGPFRHLSLHGIPFQHVGEYKKFLAELKALDIIKEYSMFSLSEPLYAFPDFRFYNPTRKEWRFDWIEWFRWTRVSKDAVTIPEPKDYRNLAQKGDILILRELERNGRQSFAAIAKLAGVTLQAIKYRYDRNIMGKGLVHQFGFTFLPYPPELSDLREMLVEFKNHRTLSRVIAVLLKLPFVMAASKIVGKNSVLLRTYTPRSEETNFFALFSELARARIVANYIPLKLNMGTIRRQTLSYELFDREKGWIFDYAKCVAALRKMA